MFRNLGHSNGLKGNLGSLKETKENEFSSKSASQNPDFSLLHQAKTSTQKLPHFQV
jgi:hypothetical protein